MRKFWHFRGDTCNKKLNIQENDKIQESFQKLLGGLGGLWPPLVEIGQFWTLPCTFGTLSCTFRHFGNFSCTFGHFHAFFDTFSQFFLILKPFLPKFIWNWAHHDRICFYKIIYFYRFFLTTFDFWTQKGSKWTLRDELWAHPLDQKIFFWKNEKHLEGYSPRDTKNNKITRMSWVISVSAQILTLQRWYMQ